MSSEFNDLKGLPPTEVPYRNKPIPTELKEVEKKENVDATKLKLADYWNIIYAILSDYALSKLDVTSQNKVLSVRTVLAIIGAVIVLFLFILLLRY